MRRLISIATAAGLLAAGAANAQPASPVQGSQPGTQAPGVQPLPPNTGSGSAPIGPPATTPSTTPSTPGTPSDTPSAGGGK
jgi:hypothetical protein